MATIKTSELSGLALDWAVAKCGYQYRPVDVPKYSSDWSQAGPIIEREGISIVREGGSEFFSEVLWSGERRWHCDRKTGPTPLIAAMRCHVASKLGDAVDVPDVLIVKP
jgi:hypothetical protein